ncbi:MAG: Ankyrin repeats (3 copies) [Candidatus Accumulibacter sp. SK-11]|nr:MAG: Ankyrin repeats (3 copies) [Candidatus Accumulibacter sp. SK-11]
MAHVLPDGGRRRVSGKGFGMKNCRQGLPGFQDSLAAFVASARVGDVAAMRAQVSGGFDINGYDALGDTVLQHVIGALEACPSLCRYQAVREMLRLGADPGSVGRDGSSPLFQACVNMDSGLLRILLDAGADPNAMLRILAGTGGEAPAAGADGRCHQSLYDWARFAYCYEVWHGRLPGEAGPSEGVGEEAWLDHVDRLAVSHGRKRPDHLRLLRQCGALRLAELRQQAAARTASAVRERRVA